MNKIYIDTRNYDLKITENETYFLEITTDLTLKIELQEKINSKVYLNILNSQVDISILVKEENTLVINSLGINSSTKIKARLDANSNLRYVNSLIANSDSLNEIQIIQNEENSKCVFLANGVNLSNQKFVFKIDGIIPKESLNSYLEESSQIINFQDGNSQIIPNLIVDSKEVIANHAAFIGKFSSDMLTYLLSRGIDYKEASRLLIKATLFKGMNLEEQLEKQFTDFLKKFQEEEVIF